MAAALGGESSPGSAPRRKRAKKKERNRPAAGTRRDTHPSPNLALPEAALLANFVRPSEFFHVAAEVALPAVLCAPTGLAFAAHPCRTLDLLLQGVRGGGR